jgi:hypothetical protein
VAQVLLALAAALACSSATRRKQDIAESSSSMETVSYVQQFCAQSLPGIALVLLALAAALAVSSLLAGSSTSGESSHLYLRKLNSLSERCK